MKRLNRKGFTLIELLAVIVILAIVMVVTIPSVLNAMDNARHSQLQNAADAVAEWLNKQYELQKLGMETDNTFSTWYDNYAFVQNNGKSINYFKNELDGNINDCAGSYSAFCLRSRFFFSPKNGPETGTEVGINVLTAAGISDVTDNIDSSYGNWVKIDKNDKFCVVLVAKENGSFYVNNEETSNFAISSGCESYMDSLYAEGYNTSCGYGYNYHISS